MNERIVAFYTDPRARAIRFLLYACFAVVVSAYIVINRLVFSRPESAVSLEVTVLLTGMVMTAPLIYPLLSRKRYPEVRRLTQRTLSGRLELALAQGIVRNRVVVVDERYDLELKLLFEQLRTRYERSELALSLATIVLICTGSVLFIEGSGEWRIILATAVSVITTVSQFIRTRLEHRRLDEILTVIYGEKLYDNADTNIIIAKKQS